MCALLSVDSELRFFRSPVLSSFAFCCHDKDDSKELTERESVYLEVRVAT